MSIFIALVLVIILLALFILPDYICWKRRLSVLPSVMAHQIQFVDESTAKEALKLILAHPKEKQFDKFCEVSRALTKTKARRAGHDGLLFDGEFQIGSMPKEFEALERALFSYKNEPDSIVGPIQTHSDAYHLAYIVTRKDPQAEKLKERIKAEQEKAQGKRTKEMTTQKNGNASRPKTD